MKKFLVWFVCLLIAAALAQLVPGCVHPGQQYITEAERLSSARTVGIFTMIIYGAAFFIARAITRDMPSGIKSKSKKKTADEPNNAPESGAVVDFINDVYKKKRK